MDSQTSVLYKTPNSCRLLSYPARPSLADDRKQVWETPLSYEPVIGQSDRNWLIAHHAITRCTDLRFGRGIPCICRGYGYHSEPVRVELIFYRRINTDYCGLVVFDAHNQIMLHVVDAIFFGDCYSYMLLKSLLSVLGLTSNSVALLEMLAYNQYSKSGGSYMLVASRQWTYTTATGQITIDPSGKMTENWNCFASPMRPQVD